MTDDERYAQYLDDEWYGLLSDESDEQEEQVGGPDWVQLSDAGNSVTSGHRIA